MRRLKSKANSSPAVTILKPWRHSSRSRWRTTSTFWMERLLAMANRSTASAISTTRKPRQPPLPLAWWRSRSRGYIGRSCVSVWFSLQAFVLCFLSSEILLCYLSFLSIFFRYKMLMVRQQAVPAAMASHSPRCLYAKESCCAHVRRSCEEGCQWNGEQEKKKRNRPIFVAKPLS